jgi:DNA-binding SARP family transcriptional activator
MTESTRPPSSADLPKLYPPATVRWLLEFRVLGPLEVADEGVVLTLGGPKQRATLAILLLQANAVVSIDRLADDLYAGHPPVTAVTQVQRQVSDLRRALGSRAVIETRSPGYVVRVSPGQFDLDRFEALTRDASGALREGRVEDSASLFQDALALWRGAPLADFAYDAFAQTAIARLEEMRLTTLEGRIEADLALGRHALLLGELEQLVWEHPLRERLQGQLMLALYRSGRQADALALYQRLRARLNDEFGLEPTRALRELQLAILRQNPELTTVRPKAGEVAHVAKPDRAVLVVATADEPLERLTTLAQPLAVGPGRELILIRLAADENELRSASATVSALRESPGVPVRTAAFTTVEPARETIRLASTYDIDLVLVEAPATTADMALPSDLAVILERSPADVAALSGQAVDGSGIYVPFGGGEHDWAALELGAWFASATAAPLRLLGTRTGGPTRKRDASRLLAHAALAVQKVVGVNVEPILADQTETALIDAVEPARLVVLGISPRWRHEGIGAVRHALVRHARPPVLVVHRGPRPSGLAPHDSRTRFSWEIRSTGSVR